ncbi:MAG: DUF6787 family protein [Bacteroidota bacterium]|jgi:hypothetical protein
MFNQLRNKWGVGGWQFVLILSTFAAGGTACSFVGKQLLSLLLPKDSWLYSVLFIPTITLLWPFCVLLISIPLGQYKFFINYLNRIWKRMSGR